jgi:glycerol dehydrogenase
LSGGGRRLLLEGRPPGRPEDIGLDGVGREELESVAEAACVEGETIHNMLVDVLLAADAFGRQRRAALEGEALLPAVAH